MSGNLQLRSKRRGWLASVATVCAVLYIIPASAEESLIAGVPTATGKEITPAVAHGAIFQELDPRLGDAPERRPPDAAAIAVSPDGSRLAIETSGFPVYFDERGNLLPDASQEYVFVFDITGRQPKQLQALPLPNSFPGLAWSATSDRIFVSGGKDDTVVEFVAKGDAWVAGRTITLGHKTCLGVKTDSSCGPVTGGIAISPDGTHLLVANIQNDSVSLIDLARGQVVSELDLRPGILDPRRRGEAGGSFPRTLVWISSSRAYVASARDREIISLAFSKDSGRVLSRIAVPGVPAALIANRSGSRLYVALDTTSQVAVLDSVHDRLIETFSSVAPPSIYDGTRILGGANTNALALTPDERMLLVSNGGQNSVAVVRLSDRSSDIDAGKRTSSPSRKDDDDEDRAHSATVGLVPTGWYPTDVATSKNGATWYIINGKSPTGPNSSWCRESQGSACDPKVSAQTENPAFAYPGNFVGQLLAHNAQVNQLEHSGFLTMPNPDALELARLTKQVAHNNRFDRPDKTADDERLFAFLRNHIKHVIYIMKENRSYDQVLGDLEVGNGDPRLTLFPEKISPNHHAIARNFVTLDNLLVSGEGSITGKDWTFAAQTSDMIERTDPLSLTTGYKGETGGFPYGNDRLAYTAYATSEERHAFDPSMTADADILPSTHRIYDIDGPGGEAGTGYIWNAALRAGLSVRNYGSFLPFDWSTPIKDPRAAGIRTFQAEIPALVTNTDPYWPTGWVPDFWRVREWKHEFNDYVASGSLPNLMVLWLWMDHTGLFDKSLDGVNTPETQMADNDYAIGTLLETLAASPYAQDTLVITIEDDASDGPDHVDAQRSVALFAGPYVRQRAVISTRFTTVNVVKTIEEVLGMGPIGLNDALAAPMSEVFDPNASSWSYKAIVPDVLRSTRLPLPPSEHATIAYPTHSAKYWARVTAGQDFSQLDAVDFATFNRALWRGLKGKLPYPGKKKQLD